METIWEDAEDEGWAGGWDDDTTWSDVAAETDAEGAELDAGAPFGSPARRGRDAVGRDTLRPKVSRRARFVDKRRPVRATAGLIVLVVLGSATLAVAIGVAFALIALAVQRSLG